MLNTPGVAREAEQRVRRPPHEVVPAPLLEIGAVIRVMLHAEGGQHRAGNEAQEAEGSTTTPGCSTTKTPQELAVRQARSAP